MSGVVNGPETIGTMSCVINEPDVEFIALCVAMMAAFAVLMVASLVLSVLVMFLNCAGQHFDYKYITYLNKWINYQMK